ncbi:hypothetical protein PVK06_007951 [Gossypium arboreum]|uniref:Uncharacterized protein n=1 Tax=Gossypium arboreum TaxID=29729 RepID=A0ABR0QJF2_GOSAR|nr:hypothetical protein PVK06_007951 [Gossypium arboreum]
MDHLTHLNSMEEQLREFVVKFLDSNVEAMQRVLNSTGDRLAVRDDALETMVTASKEQIEKLKGELVICKTILGNGMLAMTPKHKVDVPKLKEFMGMRFVIHVDNFLWGMEQFFHTGGIMDDATKRLRFTDKKRGGVAIRTWEDFQNEFKGKLFGSMLRMRLWLSCTGLRNKAQLGMRDYPQRSMFFKTYKDDKAKPDEERVLRLGSMILNFAKVKRDRKKKRLMFVDINIAS